MTHCECSRPFGKMKFTIKELVRNGSVNVIVRKRVCKTCHEFWCCKDENE